MRSARVTPFDGEGQRPTPVEEPDIGWTLPNKQPQQAQLPQQNLVQRQNITVETTVIQNLSVGEALQQPQRQKSIPEKETESAKPQAQQQQGIPTLFEGDPSSSLPRYVVLNGGSELTDKCSGKKDSSPAIYAGAFSNAAAIANEKLRRSFSATNDRINDWTPKQRALVCAFLVFFLVFLLLILFLVVFVIGATKPRSLYDDADAEGIVKLHDELRASVTPGPPIDMEKMLWNDALATAAQGYAEECTWGHGQPKWIGDLEIDGSPLSEETVGQNMFRGANDRFDWKNATNLWFNERVDYHYATTTCNKGKECGHYTQLVWSTSKHIGCGWHKCPHKDFIICNYFPPGNWKGEKPYKV